VSGGDEPGRGGRRGVTLVWTGRPQVRPAWRRARRAAARRSEEVARIEARRGGRQAQGTGLGTLIFVPTTKVLLLILGLRASISLVLTLNFTAMPDSVSPLLTT
jgi:hypothetical protein